MVNRYLLGAQQGAPIIRRHFQVAERHLNLFRNALPPNLISKQFQEVKYFYLPRIVYFLFHEIIKRLSFFGVLSYQQVGSFQSVITKRAQGSHFIGTHFLYSDEITHRGKLMCQVVVSQRIGCAATIPALDFYQINAQRLH